MGKWDKKPTPKERRYAILILFIATITAVLLLYIISFTIPSPVPFYLIIGVALIFVIPVVCYVNVTKYRENVYGVTGGGICILVIIVIIVVVVGYYFSRTP